MAAEAVSLGTGRSRSWRSLQQHAGLVAVSHGPYRTALQYPHQQTIGWHQHILHPILVEHRLGALPGNGRPIILAHTRCGVGVPSTVYEDLQLRHMPDQVSAPYIFMKHPAVNSVCFHVGNRTHWVRGWILIS